VRAVRTYVELGTTLAEQALLAEVIAPGQTVEVDVAVTGYTPGPPTTENRLDRVLNAAAAAFHPAGPNQLAVVALAEPAPDRPKHTFGAVTDLVVQMATVEGSGGEATPGPITIALR